MNAVLEADSREARDSVDFARAVLNVFVGFSSGMESDASQWSAILLNRAYGAGEPEYSSKDIKQWNPDYVEKR